MLRDQCEALKATSITHKEKQTQLDAVARELEKVTLRAQEAYCQVMTSKHFCMEMGLRSNLTLSADLVMASRTQIYITKR